MLYLGCWKRLSVPISLYRVRVIGITALTAGIKVTNIMNLMIDALPAHQTYGLSCQYADERINMLHSANNPKSVFVNMMNMTRAYYCTKFIAKNVQTWL